MFSRVSRLRSVRGTSFLEVMIALLIMGIVTTGIFQLYIRQHNNYVVQDDITTVQQNARASLDELVRDIRMAGHDLPLGVTPIVASNTNPDTITVFFRPKDCESKLSAAMPQPSAELKCLDDVSCFEDGEWVYIFEPDSGGGEWFEITQVQTAAKHIQHNTMSLSRCYTSDAIMMAMTWVKFYVDSTSNPDVPPVLMVERPGTGPQVFAENISNLNFRYRMKNGLIFDVPPIIDDVREVLITVTGRSAHADYEAVGGDSLRTRTYASSVYLRNVGI